MSLIATNPSVLATWSPSRTRRQNRQSSGGDGNDALLGETNGLDTDELADRCIDQERRVVVAVAPARAVDQHEILRAELRLPTSPLELMPERTEARAAFALLGRCDGVVCAGRGSGTGRVREDVHAGDARSLDCAERISER